MLTSILAAALSLVGTPITPVTPNSLEMSPDTTEAARVCAQACNEYLADSSAALRCNVQCAVESGAYELDAPSVDIPDWMSSSATELEWTTDHDWCLQTCDDASSETNRETCRLNCVTTWAVLTTEPEVCESGRDHAYDSELCESPATNACERGCFVDAVSCRDACEDADDARATDIASCKLRCGNVSDLCERSCSSESPDDFIAP